MSARRKRNAEPLHVLDLPLTIETAAPARHTPGPWRVDVRESSGPELDRDVVAVDILKDDRRIGSATVRPDYPSVANGRLMAMAPTMREALEEIRHLTRPERADACEPDTVARVWRLAKEALGATGCVLLLCVGACAPSADSRVHDRVIVGDREYCAEWAGISRRGVVQFKDAATGGVVWASDGAIVYGGCGTKVTP